MLKQIENNIFHSKERTIKTFDNLTPSNFETALGHMTAYACALEISDNDEYIIYKENFKKNVEPIAVFGKYEKRLIKHYEGLFYKREFDKSTCQSS